MKRKIKYIAGGIARETIVNHIPFRYIAAIAVLIAEVVSVLAAMTLLCIYVPYNIFIYVSVFTQLAVAVQIIASDKTPDHKIPWLFFVLLLPVVGYMLYFMFSSRKLKRKYVKRLKAMKNKGYRSNDDATFAKLQSENEIAFGQAKMLCRIADAHLFTETQTTYLPLGEEMFGNMLLDLSQAKKFIYMEYFIIENGIFWDSVLDILIAKVKQGVEIKVLYDDIGCMATLPGNYVKVLRAYGIQAAVFSRLRGNADSEFNNRSHRKITVIDGYIGYTGGINLADEYINEVEKYGHWKDVGVRLEGNAVWELTKLFLIDYGINVKKEPVAENDLYPVTARNEHGYVIPFGDGPSPLYERRVGKCVIENLLFSAKHYAYITTPYLIIDDGLCAAIENTALRGVDVRMIVPHIPDKKMIFGMTRSFYPRLTKAGVKIYEYAPGFIHAKSYLVDDEYAMIGTINLDYRSLVHHFENGVWMYRSDCIKDLRADFDGTLSKSVLITEEMQKTNPMQRIIRSVVRIFAPML